MRRPANAISTKNNKIKRKIGFNFGNEIRMERAGIVNKIALVSDYFIPPTPLPSCYDPSIFSAEWLTLCRQAEKSFTLPVMKRDG